jgi:hypothetical protein
MILLHELASWCVGWLDCGSRTIVARHPTSLPGATHANNGGKLFLLGAKTLAAFLFTQPLCLGKRVAMELIAITPAGTTVTPIEQIPNIAREVMKSSAAMYRTTGCQPPWIGYLAVDGAGCVGTCAFKSPPLEGRVEIAYFTFPGNEGRGVATAMVKALIELAKRASSSIRIFAQTLPQPNASTRVLEKLGFERTAEIDHPEDGKVWEWELRA